MKTVVFRVDSSSQIGLGHAMRCLTLAEKLQAHEYDIVFVCRNLPGNMADFIQQKGMQVKILPDNDAVFRVLSDKKPFAITKQQVDAKQTIACLADLKNIAWMIVDHYGLDKVWEDQLKEYTAKIMVIDDLANRAHNSDLLLDQNYYQNQTERYVSLVPNSCKLLLGPQYALLRPEFRAARTKIRKVKQGINRILVFLGGADPDNVTQLVLQTLQSMNYVGVIDVVVGKPNQQQQQIKQFCAQLANCNYHCQVENMINFMLDADLAIGAGGTTVWERCCLGVPSIVICIAKNQELVVKHGGAAGFFVAIENLANLNSQLRKELSALLQDHKKLATMQVKCFSLVDGLGAERVAAVLEGEKY